MLCATNFLLSGQRRVRGLSLWPNILLAASIDWILARLTSLLRWCWGRQTPMVSYVNVHAVLDNRRIKAREAGTNSTPPAGSQRTESNAAPGQVCVHLNLSLYSYVGIFASLCGLRFWFSQFLCSLTYVGESEADLFSGVFITMWLYILHQSMSWEFLDCVQFTTAWLASSTSCKAFFSSSTVLFYRAVDAKPRLLILAGFKL